MTRDCQQCGILTSVDSDEPVQPPLMLRNSKCCSVNSFPLEDYSSIAPDKAAYCVFTQFRGPENAIKFISVRTKTQ